MDYLKHDTVTIDGNKFEITELSARGIINLQKARGEDEMIIATIVVAEGCDQFAVEDEIDIARMMPASLVVELAQAIFELSGLSEDGDQKKDSGTDPATVSNIG